MLWQGGVGPLNARVPSRIIRVPRDNVAKIEELRLPPAEEQDRVGAPSSSTAARWALPLAPEDVHSGGWSDARRIFPPPLSLHRRRNDNTFLRGTSAFASPLSHSGYVGVGAPIKGKDGERQPKNTRRPRDEITDDPRRTRPTDARTSSSQARTREPQALCKQLSP